MCFNFVVCMFRNLSVLEVHVGYCKGFYPFFILNNNDTQLSCVFEKKNICTILRVLTFRYAAFNILPPVLYMTLQQPN
jgi:hypothetical protein